MPGPVVIPFSIQEATADFNPTGLGVRFLCGTADGITAHAGGGQANAFPIPGNVQIARVTVVASGNDSVLLPPSAPGLEITVVNATAATSMNVYATGAEVINAIAANSPFAVAGTKTVTFYCATAGQWHTQLSA